MDRPFDEIQILELHSAVPIVSYRNHIFRGSWAENVGTEMIFTPHNEKAPLPALRNLQPNVDLLACSAARINFTETSMIPKGSAELIEEESMNEDLPDRYKRNGGIYIHIGGDKTGQRQPQAHFLEDLIALKRKRGERDEVTVQPLETRQNKLMVDDEEEERRRKKMQTDQARNARWRDIRRGVAEADRALAKGASGQRVSRVRRGPDSRPRARRAVLIRRESPTDANGPTEVSSTTPGRWKDLPNIGAS
jgi:hypothetical protein